ncbi:hypothetical protein JAO71_15455 [Olleya sp. YSTF-M6]|uniref:DUF4890 domain-containing protein n=1 Tax=Olleya sediminilitoris TaxID=2795739 RepID=A0ABS1WPZ1_9FLAO|nr:hypothetical protein [Olleya sediminilitoris]MBL7561195.1 hypothetical protein [Olleya sediminilitoris]
MKKLAIIALALITFQANAQDKKEQRQDNRKEKMEKRMQLEPEEMAELQTKKMTLHLDLTDAQQKKVMALNLEHAKKRKEAMKSRLEAKDKEEKVKPTKEEKLKRANQRLDDQIATKREMKSILSAEQYEKWEKSQTKRKHGRKKGDKKRKDHHNKKDRDLEMED